MKKFGLGIVVAATVFLSACGGNNNSSSKNTSHKETAAEMASKANAVAAKKEEKDPYVKLGNNLRAGNDDIAGVNGADNGDASPLVVVLNGYSAYSSMISSEFAQKHFLLRLMDTFDQVKSNSKAHDGVVFTGGYIKMDNGVTRPTFTAYFNSDAVKQLDFKNDVLNGTHPLDFLTGSTNYGLLRVWFQTNGPKGGMGIFKDTTVDGYADAPTWLTHIMNGKSRITGRGIKAVKDSKPYDN